MYDFEVYSGKCDQDEDFPSLLMGVNVVSRLCQTLPPKVNYNLYLDNYFSSLQLVQYLTKEKIWAVTTIWRDRLKGGGKHLKSEKELKQAGQGAMD